jgi:hypothetical protein
LEAKRRFYAHPGSYLALTRVPPPVPCPGRDRQLLSSFERPLLAVDQERDAAVQNLEVLGTVVVKVLAAGDEPTLLDSEVGDDPCASGFLGGFDQQRLLASQRIPDNVASAASTHEPMLFRPPVHGQCPHRQYRLGDVRQGPYRGCLRM